MAYEHTVYFVSKNEYKLREIRDIWKSKVYYLESCSESIIEIQDSSIQKIVEAKAKEAYKRIFRPVLVEHSGLILPEYGNLPGGLTKIVWDSLTENGNHPEKFSELFAPSGSTPAIAQSVVAYCDGRTVFSFIGEVHGNIVKVPRGKNGFAWDCVFEPIPNVGNLTFAEMNDFQKIECSMRSLAMRHFLDYLDKIESKEE